jgi:enoyl-CoA hydratase/carnithine racemase
MGAAQEVGGSDTRVRLEVDGPIATITNDNVTKHNAFDDAMDARLFEILGELRVNPDVRAVVWRGEGRSWSSGRDVSAIGVPYTEEEHAALMRRGHDGIQQVWDLDAPVFVAIQGWAIGGSFQRALLCDVRVAAEDARFMLPELGHGVIPDTGGMGVLAQLAGHGLVSDMVLTGRRLDAEEALRYGIVSRVVPNDELDATVYGMAEQAAAADPRAVAMARQVVGNLLRPGLAASMADERTFQTRLNQERGRGDRP